MGFIMKWPCQSQYSVEFELNNRELFCRVVSDADYNNLETLAKSIVKDKQPFERLVVSKEDLLTMFKHNPYKVHIINDKIPDGTSTTVYRCGPLVDLCRGPHVPDTGKVKAFSVMKVGICECRK